MFGFRDQLFVWDTISVCHYQISMDYPHNLQESNHTDIFVLATAFDFLNWKPVFGIPLIWLILGTGGIVLFLIVVLTCIIVRKTMKEKGQDIVLDYKCKNDLQNKLNIG